MYDSSVGGRSSNIEPVDLTTTVRVTERVGEEAPRTVLVIQRDGRAFQRCHACGRLRRIAPGDSQ